MSKLENNFEALVDPRFAGIDRLYGAGSVACLDSMHVAVIGIGGVGSWAAEALVRSGLGSITLVDADEVCLSNTNRQLHALEGNYGQSKIAVMAKRLQAIAPDCDIHLCEHFLTPSNLQQTLDKDFDLVLDACDAFRVKVEMIAWAKRHKLPLVTVGSAGGRVDSTQIRVRDLSRTEQDAMLSLIRKKLRQDYHFPRNQKRFFGIPAVYSLENVHYPQADGSVSGVRPKQSGSGMRLACGNGSLGAATHVTASFAFAAVGCVLQKLLHHA